MPTTIDLSDVELFPRNQAVKTARVWVRTSWGDPWTIRPDLIPTQSTWTIAPRIDTASLHYRYGNVLQPGGSSIETVVPISASDFWVLIGWLCDDGDPMWWLGKSGFPRRVDHQPARDGHPETGKQIIDLVGMMRLLQQTPVTSVVRVDEAGDAGQWTRSENVGATFNPTPKGNRTASLGKLFAGEENETTDAHAFASPGDLDATTWSTKDIISHLAAFHLPTPTGVREPSGVPWAFDVTLAPDWDSPSVPTDGRSVAGILDSLLVPKKLSGWRIVPSVTYDLEDEEALPDVTEVKIEAITSPRSPVLLPSGDQIDQAENQFELLMSADPLTIAEITEDGSDLVDQIEVRGPREVAVATLRHASELENGWGASESSEYATAAAAEPGYLDSMTLAESRAADARVRDTEKLKPVYRDLQLKADWNGTAEGDPVFVTDEQVPGPHVPYLGLVKLLSDLPLYAEVDYTGAADEVDESAGLKTTSPLLTLENPEDATRDPIDKLGRLDAGANTRQGELKPFRLSAELDNDPTPTIRLNVGGAPRHAIAGSGFAESDADAKQKVWGDYDYTTLEATVAMLGDRRPAWRIPAPEDLETKDNISRRVFTLDHAALTLVHIAAATVVGIDPAGDPLTSDGGVLRDPMDKLKSLATIIAQHQLQFRHQIKIVTQRRLSAMLPGDLLVAIDARPSIFVDTPIQEIRIDAPIGDGDRRGPVKQSFQCEAYPPAIAELVGDK